MDDPNGEPGGDGAGSPSSPLSDGATGFKEDDPLRSITVKLHMLHAVSCLVACEMERLRDGQAERMRGRVADMERLRDGEAERQIWRG